jgi:hypothetical protein
MGNKTWIDEFDENSRKTEKELKDWGDKYDKDLDEGSKQYDEDVRRGARKYDGVED